MRCKLGRVQGIEISPAFGIYQAVRILKNIRVSSDIIPPAEIQHRHFHLSETGSDDEPPPDYYPERQPHWRPTVARGVLVICCTGSNSSNPSGES